MSSFFAAADHAGPEPQSRRFTVDEFQRMGEAGVFAPDERVELIAGVVIRMPPVGPRHMEGVFAVEDLLRPIAGPDVRVSVQGPVQLKESQPLPDVVLLQRARLRKGRLPTPGACLLVVEVADSSGTLDRGDKRHEYARNSVPEYWVVDVAAETVVVHTEPLDSDYRTVSEHVRGSAFTSPALGGRTICVDDVLDAR